MSVLVKNLGDFLKLLVQAFNLSSIFPALIFVILVQLYVLPLLSQDSLLGIDKMWDATTKTGIHIILVVFIAYLLDAANLQIIGIFEGYGLSHLFPLNWLQKRNRDFVSRTWARIRELEWLIDRLTDQGKQQERIDLLDLAEKLLTHKRELIKEVEKFPEDPEYVLPTPFGNVIAVAEQYPRKIFGMDSVVLWPFLIPTLTKKNYAQFIVREKAVMDFLVNITVVLAGFGCLLGIVEWWVNGLSGALIVKLSLVALSCILTFVLSIQGAATWGDTIRAAFVIFREDLRQTLRLRKPQDYEDERSLWETTSNFFRAQGSQNDQKRWGHAIFDEASYEHTSSNKERKTCQKNRE